MAKFEPIKTDRLTIRKFEDRDKEDFFNYRSLPEIYEYQFFKPTETKEVDVFFERLTEQPNIPDTWFQLAVCITADNAFIGDIGIHFLEDGRQAEIGFTIAPGFQGVGYANEAVRSVLHYLFFVLKKHRIIASVDPLNKKSINLLEKLGMRREAHFAKSILLKDRWLDDCIYAILSEEMQNIH